MSARSGTSTLPAAPAAATQTTSARPRTPTPPSAPRPGTPTLPQPPQPQLLSRQESPSQQQSLPQSQQQNPARPGSPRPPRPLTPDPGATGVGLRREGIGGTGRGGAARIPGDEADGGATGRVAGEDGDDGGVGTGSSGSPRQFERNGDGSVDVAEMGVVPAAATASLGEDDRFLGDDELAAGDGLGELMSPDAIYSVQKMAEVLVLGPDAEREFILFELQQLLDHCPDDTLKILLPVLCEYVPTWNLDLQTKATQRLFDVVSLDLAQPTVKLVASAVFGVVESARGNDSQEVANLYNLCGGILIEALPNMKPWSTSEANEVIAIVDVHMREPLAMSRKIAARVLGALATSFEPGKVERQVLPRVLSLFDDTDVQVRGVVIESLAFLGANLPVRVTETDVWPRVERLLDPAEDARIHGTAMRTMAHILQHQREKGAAGRLFRDQLPPVFFKISAFARRHAPEDQRLVDDDTYMLLEVVSEVFGQFVYSLSLFARRSFLKDAYKAYSVMATCNGPLIRRACAFNLPGVAKALGERFAMELSGLCEFLAKDMDDEVRWILAAGIHQSATLLCASPRGSYDRLFSAVCSLLEDENPLVRMNALEHFHELLSAFVRDYSDPASIRRLAPVFTNLSVMSEGDWRIQKRLAEQLDKCAEIIPSDALVSNVLPLLYQLTEQGTPLVRQAAMSATARALRNIQSIPERNASVNRFWGQARTGPFWMRLAMLDGASAALRIFSSQRFQDLFAPTLLQLAHDPVANVRIRFASILPDLAPTCGAMPAYAQAVDQLRQDGDPDVLAIMAKHDAAVHAAMGKALENANADATKFREEQEFYGILPRSGKRVHRRLNNMRTGRMLSNHRASRQVSDLADQSSGQLVVSPSIISAAKATSAAAAVKSQQHVQHHHQEVADEDGQHAGLIQHASPVKAHGSMPSRPASPARPGSPGRPVVPGRPASPARPSSPARPASPSVPMRPASPSPQLPNGQPSQRASHQDPRPPSPSPGSTLPTNSRVSNGSASSTTDAPSVPPVASSSNGDGPEAADSPTSRPSSSQSAVSGVSASSSGSGSLPMTSSTVSNASLSNVYADVPSGSADPPVVSVAETLVGGNTSAEQVMGRSSPPRHPRGASTAAPTSASTTRRKKKPAPSSEGTSAKERPVSHEVSQYGNQNWLTVSAPADGDAAPATISWLPSDGPKPLFAEDIDADSKSVGHLPAVGVGPSVSGASDSEPSTVSSNSNRRSTSGVAEQAGSVNGPVSARSRSWGERFGMVPRQQSDLGARGSTGTAETSNVQRAVKPRNGVLARARTPRSKSSVRDGPPPVAAEASGLPPKGRKKKSKRPSVSGPSADVENVSRPSAVSEAVRRLESNTLAERDASVPQTPLTSRSKTMAVPSSTGGSRGYGELQYEGTPSVPGPESPANSNVKPVNGVPGDPMTARTISVDERVMNKRQIAFELGLSPPEVSYNGVPVSFDAETGLPSFRGSAPWMRNSGANKVRHPDGKEIALSQLGRPSQAPRAQSSLASSVRADSHGPQSYSSNHGRVFTGKGGGAPSRRGGHPDATGQSVTASSQPSSSGGFLRGLFGRKKR